MPNNPILEVCTGTLGSVQAAAHAGAYRVEVCAALEVGGLTPSMAHIKAAVAVSGIKKNVLIRPRAGHFVYDEHEISMMEEDIRLCSQLGADGVVVGALTEDGDLDVSTMQRLIEAAGDMSITFHRAFDVCRNPFGVMEQLIDLGVHRILTSGQAPTALQGLPLLRQLVEKADGRIIIMPGSGVNAENVSHIIQESGACEIHSSAKGGLSFDSPMFPGVSESTESKIREILAELVKK